MRALRTDRATRWKMGTLLLACLTLALTGVRKALTEEPPASMADLEKSPEPWKAQAQQAEQRLQELEKRAQEIEEELKSHNRERSLEKIREELEAIRKERAMEKKRLQEANRQRDDALKNMLREHDERGSGLSAVPPEKRIRADFHAWDDQGQAAARAFCAKHPAFRFYRPSGGAGFGSFREGHIDLMGWTNDYRDHFSGNEQKAFDAAFPMPPKSITVGYWPFAVAVHPGNPIKNLALDQLRTLATNQNVTWKDLGRPKDGLIRLYMFDTYHVTELLTGKKNGGVLSRHQVFNRDWGYMDKTLKAVAEDQDAILIWHHTARIAGSGLKILPLIDSHGMSLLPTDLPAVASGRYVLRTPLTIMVHPQASEAAKQFAQWLTTAEAADAIQAARDQFHPADAPFLAHATLAAKDVPAKEGSMGATPQREKDKPSIDNRGAPSTAQGRAKIGGAVAVMPTELLSMYFLMAKPSHQAAYEQAITDTIAADGRLKLIDRTQLARVLEERKREIMGSQKGLSRAIVAADVFVFSWVATEGSRAYLQANAIHGPTASLLDELRLPIDPADPIRFNPPLRQFLAAWWPRVLQGLADVRDKPIWSLVDVYASTMELDEAAELVRGELEAALSVDSRIFLSYRISAGQTQEEMLLRLMGLSRPEGGRFGPAADYLLEARLTAPDRIDLRFRGADLTVLDKTEIVGSDRAEMLADARAWLTAQVTKHSAKPPVAALPPPSVESEWARAQARLEYETGRQLDTNASKRHEAGQHYRRAAQLDPTWEKAAYAAMNSHGSDNWIFVEGIQREASFAEPIDAYERFLRRFPKSEHAQEVLAKYVWDCMNLAGKGKIPPGLDERMTRLTYYRKGMEGCRECIAEYTLRGKDSSDGAKFMPSNYLYWLQKYIELADPPETECQAIVKDWSESYDTHLDQMSHSDFVRLMVLAQKKDRAGFIALLTKMQQRWPDPKHPQWQRANELVRHTMYSLFYPYSRSNSFELWLAGKRGIGDLPYVGYDPRKYDKPSLHGSFILCCRGCNPPMRSLVEAYRKRQTGVKFLFDASPYPALAFNAFVHGERQVFAYCGVLNEREQQQLKMMHKGPPQEILLGYWASPDPNRNVSSNSAKEADRRQPLVFLAQPEPSEAIQEFVKWLATPEAREILTRSGVILKREERTDPTGTEEAAGSRR